MCFGVLVSNVVTTTSNSVLTCTRRRQGYPALGGGGGLPDCKVNAGTSDVCGALGLLLVCVWGGGGGATLQNGCCERHLTHDLVYVQLTKAYVAETSCLNCILPICYV